MLVLIMPKAAFPKVLFVGSEAAPYAKVGGLGDILGSLPKALAKKGIRVGIIIPKYANIGKRYKLKKVLKNFEISSRAREKVSVYSLKNKRVKFFFIENKEYLSKGPIYFEHTAFVGSFKEIQRFLFFSIAVFELIKSGRLPFNPDIVHANDWHTGALVSLIKNKKLPPKTVFAIHNLANQGKWNAKITKQWLCRTFKESYQLDSFGQEINLMAEGIKYSDVLTTVSPTYAREIKTTQYGAGLQNIIKKRKKIIGILNGVDYSIFNPSTDRFLSAKYGPRDLPKKAENKIALQKKYKLTVDKNKPLFGLVARLTGQKGIELIIPPINYFTKQRNAQFVFLGMGETKYENALRNAAKNNPQNVFAKIGFDEGLAHQIYAASDFFLMPSIFEPCGLGQMIAMRYGALPICRKTGGLKDSVKDGKNGLLFQEASAGALKKTMQRALRLFSDKKEFLKIQRQCFREDFSWKNQAQKYIDIYQNLL